ncbi:PEF1 family protein [Megaselia abdita]
MSYQDRYGGYGGYQPPQQNSSVQQWFTNVDRDRSGKINAEELKSALINGQGEHFSDNSCKLMISMFDKDASGTIDIYEFEKLFNYVNQWLQVFKSYDRDSSGHIDQSELTQAFTQMGFTFSPEFITFLVKKLDPIQNSRISVDNFIVVCVRLQRFTEAFRVRDTEQKGQITIGFEDFLSIGIRSSI